MLRGAKQWITSGPIAGVFVVWARTGGPGTSGISCFLVEGGTPGLKVGRHEDKMGARGVPSCPLFLDEVFVPEANRIGEDGRGFKAVMEAFNKSRPLIGARGVGLAQGAIDLAIGFVQGRVTWGRAVSEYQGIRWMLADMATQTEAARQLVYSAAAAVDAGLAGNALAGNQATLPAASAYVWTFATAAAAVPPANVSVLSTQPAASAGGVCTNASINATFSVPSGLRMDDLLTDEGPRNAKPKRAFRRWLIVLGVLVVALVVGFASVVVWGVGQLNAVKREPGLLPPEASTTTNTTDLDDQPLNFLLLGSDSRGDDRGRSDVMMLVHADPSRDRLYLISLPRDLWVPIPGHGTNKINAAYAFGGAPLAVQIGRAHV